MRSSEAASTSTRACTARLRRPPGLICGSDTSPASCSSADPAAGSLPMGTWQVESRGWGEWHCSNGPPTPGDLTGAANASAGLMSLCCTMRRRRRTYTVQGRRAFSDEFHPSAAWPCAVRTPCPSPSPPLPPMAASAASSLSRFCRRCSLRCIEFHLPPEEIPVRTGQ